MKLKNRTILGAIGALTLMIISSTVLAQQPMLIDEGETFTRENWPLALVERPLTLGAGMLEVRGDIFINASNDAFGEPIGVSPDIYYGVTDMLTVGIVHGVGICLGGDDRGCENVYDDVGLDALYSLVRSDTLDVALRTTLAAGTVDLVNEGIFMRPGFDPLTLSLRAGALVRWASGSLAIVADPKVSVGLTERDDAFENKEFLMIPVQVQFQATPQLAVFAITGFNGPLTYDAFDFSDSFAVPVGVGALYAVSNQLDVGARFAFPNLVGQDIFDNFGPAQEDTRYLFLTVNWRM